MNQEQRQDDRPRVASFLIDDILAPQALPSVVRCPSPHEAQSSARHISTGVTDHNTLSLCNQPLNSTCLACYGNDDHLLSLFYCSVRASVNSPSRGRIMKYTENNTLKTVLLVWRWFWSDLVHFSTHEYMRLFLVTIRFEKNAGYLIKLNRCF